MEKNMRQVEEQLNTIKEHISYLEHCYTEKKEDAYVVLCDRLDECMYRIEQLKFNFEVIIYILQGQVEV